MVMSLNKKYGIFLVLFFINLANAVEESKEEFASESEVVMQKEVRNNDATPWYKKGMFWFGLLNGLKLPLPYAIAIGFNLVDISHPAVEEKLKPFAQGACAGIALWVISTIITLASLQEANTSSQSTVVFAARS